MPIWKSCRVDSPLCNTFSSSCMHKFPRARYMQVAYLNLVPKWKIIWGEKDAFRSRLSHQHHQKSHEHYQASGMPYLLLRQCRTALDAWHPWHQKLLPKCHPLLISHLYPLAATRAMCSKNMLWKVYSASREHPSSDKRGNEEKITWNFQNNKKK